MITALKLVTSNLRVTPSPLQLVNLWALRRHAAIFCQSSAFVHSSIPELRRFCHVCIVFAPTSDQKDTDIYIRQALCNGIGHVKPARECSSLTLDSCCSSKVRRLQLELGTIPSEHSTCENECCLVGRLVVSGHRLALAHSRSSWICSIEKPFVSIPLAGPMSIILR